METESTTTTKQVQDWAIVVSPAGKRIGCIVEETESHVTLCPCFEYYSEIQEGRGPNGEMGIVGRSLMLMPYDHTIQPAPVTMFVHEMVRFSEMGEFDCNKYSAHVANIVKNMEAERVKRMSGLVLVPNLSGVPDAPRRA